MSDSIVITATALALAQQDAPGPIGAGPVSGAVSILRLPEEAPDRRHTGPSSRLARLIGQLAADAGLAPGDLAGPATGLVSGSRYGCSLVADMHRRLRDLGPRGIDAVGFAQATHNFPVSACAIDYGIQGPGIALVSSLAAGMEALTCGRDWLREGRCDRVIVAAFEDLHGPAAAHVELLAAPHAPPVHEAMALVLLERGSLARARGAPVLAELAGLAMVPPQGQPRAVAARAFGGDPAAPRLLIAEAEAPVPPLVDCLAVGGLLALIRALEATAASEQAQDWLVGALDPRCGGILAGLHCLPVASFAAPARQEAMA
ncbi:MAG: hypothetical protein JNN06_14235 [Gemmobacter sp.]|uniref:beta-ketoacyl synthase N-terminal-like domain-containing protein n=1 Tax=Gemmobacter sp. TaxID=1898957 RepID=UPI001A58BE6F|nr:beta-ketoacyl synthase N-terminal-like domain-containing protein [Gemmobacter sp.]MBL8563433.1 hypothetical protein [Gemmobacter sp.]